MSTSIMALPVSGMAASPSTRAGRSAASTFGRNVRRTASPRARSPWAICLAASTASGRGRARATASSGAVSISSSLSSGGSSTLSLPYQLDRLPRTHQGHRHQPGSATLRGLRGPQPAPPGDTAAARLPPFQQRRQIHRPVGPYGRQNNPLLTFVEPLEPLRGELVELRILPAQRLHPGVGLLSQGCEALRQGRFRRAVHPDVLIFRGAGRRRKMPEGVFAFYQVVVYSGAGSSPMGKADDRT